MRHSHSNRPIVLLHLALSSQSLAPVEHSSTSIQNRNRNKSGNNKSDIKSFQSESLWSMVVISESCLCRCLSPKHTNSILYYLRIISVTSRNRPSQSRQKELVQALGLTSIKMLSFKIPDFDLL